MKLQQGQVWKVENGFIRITRLERLMVEYKMLKTAVTKLGTRHQVSKKEFCRLIKKGVLLELSDSTNALTVPDVATAQPEEKLPSVD